MPYAKPFEAEKPSTSIAKTSHTVGKTVGKTVGMILDFIREKPAITREEISIQTGLSVRGVEWNLKKLKKDGLLKRVGPAKGGHWEVLDK